MKDKNPAAAKVLAEITAWVARQSEPFELSELAGRFGVNRLRALRVTRRLIAAGVVEQVSKPCGAVPAVYRRVA